MTVKRNYQSLTSLLTLEKGDIVGGNKRRKMKVSSSCWNVSEKEVPPVPYLYPREETSVIVAGVCPEIIAKSIVRCAKSMSLVGSYNDDEASAVLKNDIMKCSIQLYANVIDDKKSVLVEVQRKDGDCINFHKISHAILETASNQENHSTDSIQHIVPPSDCPPSVQVVPSQEKAYDEMIITCVMEGIDSLLRKDRIDAHLLGMENLEKLTSDSSQRDIQLFTSKCIVKGGSDFDAVRNRVFSHVTNTQDFQSEQHLYMSEQHVEKFHSIALSILANSLDCLSKADDTFFEQISSYPGWGSTSSNNDSIFTSLLSAMQDADSHIYEAYLAAKCVKVILDQSPQMKANALKLDALNIASISHEVGESSYLMLGSISTEIIELLK